MLEVFYSNWMNYTPICNFTIFQLAIIWILALSNSEVANPGNFTWTHRTRYLSDTFMSVSSIFQHSVWLSTRQIYAYIALLYIVHTWLEPLEFSKQTRFWTIKKHLIQFPTSSFWIIMLATTGLDQEQECARPEMTCIQKKNEGAIGWGIVMHLVCSQWEYES